MRNKFFYPKNETHFKRLVQFAKKIIRLCKNNGIEPTIYGSFVHFYHTKDKTIEVNDIDVLIPRKDLIKLSKLLKESKFEYEYLRKWKTITVKKSNLRIEIDGIGFWYDDLEDNAIFKNPDKINFYGFKVNIMTLTNLERLYLIGHQRTKDNKEKIKDKIVRLERFLGRKLNPN